MNYTKFDEYLKNRPRTSTEQDDYEAGFEAGKNSTYNKSDEQSKLQVSHLVKKAASFCEEQTGVYPKIHETPELFFEKLAELIIQQKQLNT